MAYIYILIDPRSHEIKYVGKTTNLPFRLSKHISDSKRCAKSKVKAWINSLLKNGLRPIIQEVDYQEDFQYWEKFYISYYKFIGCALLNMTEGGENPPKCKKLSISAIEKMKTTISNKIKPIYQFSKTGDLLIEYKNSKEIIGANQEFEKIKILRCCNSDNAVFAYGYRWSYSKTPLIKHRVRGNIIFDNRTGVYYDDAKQAAISINISHSSLLRKLKGEIKKKTHLIYA